MTAPAAAPQHLATRRPDVPRNCYALRQHVAMPKRQAASGGRPSKGVRVFVATRCSPEIATAVRAEAERLDLSYSELVANVLADRYGLPRMAEPRADGQLRLPA